MWVLWRCWLGGRKGIRPVKTWVVGCWRGYLSGARCRLAQLMPLPLTVSCFSKIQIGFAFLVPAHPGSPGQRAVRRVCVWCEYIRQHVTFFVSSRCWISAWSLATFVFSLSRLCCKVPRHSRSIFRSVSSASLHIEKIQLKNWQHVLAYPLQNLFVFTLINYQGERGVTSDGTEISTIR